jgi:hypothetical protein
MADPETQPVQNPVQNTGPEPADQAMDFARFMTDPLLTVNSALGGFQIPSPLDLAIDGIDLACKLFESDSHSKHGYTYDQLMAELSKYVEGDPKTGPLQVTESFVMDDPSVPEYVKFGPASPMTQQLMVDSGVNGAREAYYLDGSDQTASKFRVDDFVRETFELESPMQPGTKDDGTPTQEISDYEVTEHMVGSYTVKMCETPEHQLLFVVLNNTGLGSGTRNPITQQPMLEDRERSAGTGFGTVHQAYYWTEPLRQP